MKKKFIRNCVIILTKTIPGYICVERVGYNSKGIVWYLYNHDLTSKFSKMVLITFCNESLHLSLTIHQKKISAGNVIGLFDKLT